jgi:hypothetical protein
VLLPSLILFIVLAGFYPWRSICPLAAFGELGRNLRRSSQRRVPRWLERGHLVVPIVILAAMLVLREVATNGDGRWIAALLVGLALAAFATNALFTGKTWCNFVCPVGVVERIYTDPSSVARSTSNSQCFRCTACKRSCPDIDQENNYWRELRAGGRRVATYAFPGIVFAFYFYFWLRTGDWEAYFDGRWTAHRADAALAFGPGFFFAPQVPAVVAAALTIAAGALVSYALFRAIEAATARFVPDRERHRHLVLSGAAFAAFSLFFLFAGAPTLRRIAGGTRVFAFVAPVIAAVVLARRWGRSHDAYLRERVAARLIRNWPFAGRPPGDPVEAYAQLQASEQAREQLLSGYAQTLRDVLEDGIIDESEARLLAEMRKQFGITNREHESVVARLGENEREVLISGRFASVEERLQIESYRAALTEALSRSASEGEIDLLRREFGVSLEDHAVILERMRSASGPLIDRARRELVEALVRRGDRELLAAIEDRDESLQLLSFLLTGAEQASLERVFDLLGTVGDRPRIDALRPGLGSRDTEARRRMFQGLAGASPEAAELLPLIDRFVPEPAVPASRTDDETVREALTRLVKDPDAFVRAAAVWSLAATSPGAPQIFEAARDDGDSLVTEAAAASLVPEDDADRAARVGRFRGRTRISRMQFLRGVPLFTDLEPRDLLDLAELTREEEIPPGQPLVEEGRPDSGDLFVILAGRASVVVREAGRQIAELGPGDVVGELSLIDGSPRSATVIPRGEPLRVLRIPAQAFRDRLLPRASVSRSLLIMMTERLRALASEVSEDRNSPTSPDA